MSPKKGLCDYFNRKYIFQSLIFRGHLKTSGVIALENGGWKTILAYCGPVTVQGQTVKLWEINKTDFVVVKDSGNVPSRY